VLGHHFLADSDFAGLYRLLVRLQLFFVDLHRLTGRGPTGRRGRGGRRPRRGRGPVVGAMAPQNGMGFIKPAIRLDGDQGAARLEFALVIVGLLLGNAQADQRADQAANDGAAGGTRQDRSQQPPGNDRPKGRQHSGGEADRPQAPHARTGDDPGRGAGAPLGAFLGGAGGCRRGRGVACHHPNLIFAKARAPQLLNCLLGFPAVVKDSNNRRPLGVRHVIPP